MQAVIQRYINVREILILFFHAHIHTYTYIKYVHRTQTRAYISSETRKKIIVGSRIEERKKKRERLERAPRSARFHAKSSNLINPRTFHDEYTPLRENRIAPIGLAYGAQINCVFSVPLR